MARIDFQTIKNPTVAYDPTTGVFAESQLKDESAFNKLADGIHEKEGYPMKVADAVAAKIGREKYGQAGMTARSEAGRTKAFHSATDEASQVIDDADAKDMTDRISRMGEHVKRLISAIRDGDLSFAHKHFQEFLKNSKEMEEIAHKHYENAGGKVDGGEASLKDWTKWNEEHRASGKRGLTKRAENLADSFHRSAGDHKNNGNEMMYRQHVAAGAVAHMAAAKHEEGNHKAGHKLEKLAHDLASGAKLVPSNQKESAQ